MTATSGPARRNRYSPEMKADAVRLYRDGLSSYDVASQLDVDATSVRGWVKAAGVPLRPPNGGDDEGSPFLNEPDASRAIALRQAGMSIEHIAAELHRAYKRVRRTLEAADAGPVHPSRRGFTADQRSEMVRLYRDDGLTIQDVATRVGTSTRTVSLALRSAGVPTRPSAGRPRSAVPGKVRSAAWAAALKELKQRHLCEYRALFAAELASRLDPQSRAEVRHRTEAER